MRQRIVARNSAPSVGRPSRVLWGALKVSWAILIVRLDPFAESPAWIVVGHRFAGGGADQIRGAQDQTGACRRAGVGSRYLLRRPNPWRCLGLGRRKRGRVFFPPQEAQIGGVSQVHADADFSHVLIDKANHAHALAAGQGALDRPGEFGAVIDVCLRLEGHLLVETTGQGRRRRRPQRLCNDITTSLEPKPPLRRLLSAARRQDLHTLATGELADGRGRSVRPFACGGV
jgi:hypothetical protein